MQSLIDDFKKAPLFVGFLFFLAVALQIQITLFSTDDYAGLRTNLADFTLPFAGVIILFSLLRHKSSWPAWNAKHVALWLIALLCVMTGALITGYFTNGFLSSWAFINKYIGFLILICYFALGGWISTNPKIELAHNLFLKIFCAFAVFVLVASFACVVLEKFAPVPLWLGKFYWDGFMANRNAFMVVVIFTMIALEIFRGHEKFPFWLHALFWTLMPVFVIYNASRTGWIFGVAIMLVLFASRPVTALKKILPFLALGLALIIGVHYFISEGEVKDGKQFQLLMALGEGDEKEMYDGDKKRLIAIEDGLELFKQHDPLIGAGLGSYEQFQIQKRGEFIDIIDFTGLWLLVETGLSGAFAFIAFFTMCLLALYKQGFGANSSLYHRALFFFLIAFAGMSFLHELMYSRYLWFALGLALANKNPGQSRGSLKKSKSVSI